MILKVDYLFPKYIAAGVFNTFAGYLIFFALLFLGADSYLSFLIAHCVGVYINFIVYSSLVFGGKNKNSVYRFVFVYIALYFSGNLMLLLADFMGYGVYKGGVILVVVNTALGYILNKHYVFNGSCDENN